VNTVEKRQRTGAVHNLADISSALLIRGDKFFGRKEAQKNAGNLTADDADNRRWDSMMEKITAKYTKRL